MIGGTDGFHSLLKVTVLGIRGTKVRLGFEVDANIPVHRSEVWERVRAEAGRQVGQVECLSAPVKTDGRDGKSTSQATFCEAGRVIAENEV
jgi:carbon storage regulator CsrA